MWWKITLGMVALAVVLIVGIVVVMAISDAKEETRDIQKADRGRKPFLNEPNYLCKKNRSFCFL